MKQAFFLLVCIATFNVGAQNKIRKNPWLVGLSAGSGVIIGELNRHYFAPHWGVFAEKQLGKVFRIGLQFNECQYKSGAMGVDYQYFGDNYTHTDKASKWDFHLKSNCSQTSLILGINFTPEWMKNAGLTCWLQTGIGLAEIRSQADYIDYRDSIGAGFNKSPNPGYKKRVNETFDGRSLFVPVGIAFEYQLSKKINLGFQFQYGFLHTDNIDLANIYTDENRRLDHFANAAIRLGYRLN